MSKEAMKLALEGAANYIDALGGDSRKYRQALAEQPAQQQEPVAWGNFKEDGTLVGLSQHPEDQANWTGRKPLYTSPPAQRKPLTKTKVGNFLRRHAHGEVSMYRNGFKDGVAFAEAAHGIKENT